MESYTKLVSAFPTDIAMIKRGSDGAYIPLDHGNADCSRFLDDWKAGAAVKNPDGSTVAYSDAAVAALGLTPPV